MKRVLVGARAGSRGIGRRQDRSSDGLGSRVADAMRIDQLVAAWQQLSDNPADYIQEYLAKSKGSGTAGAKCHDA